MHAKEVLVCSGGFWSPAQCRHFCLGNPSLEYGRDHSWHFRLWQKAGLMLSLYSCMSTFRWVTVLRNTIFPLFVGVPECVNLHSSSWEPTTDIKISSTSRPNHSQSLTCPNFTNMKCMSAWKLYPQQNDLSKLWEVQQGVCCSSGYRGSAASLPCFIIFQWNESPPLCHSSYHQNKCHPILSD